MQHQEISNDRDNNNNYNNNVNNEVNESPMRAHIAKRILPIKENTHNQLPGDLNRPLLSNTSISSTITISKDNTSTTHDEININGTKYRRINRLYCYSRNIANTRGALIDRGSNEGFVGRWC